MPGYDLVPTVRVSDIVDELISVTSNAGTASATYQYNNFTNSSASAMTITVGKTSPTPSDGQAMVIRIFDFTGGVSKGITWVNTENASIPVPANSRGSVSIPLVVGFVYNGGTALWTCVGYA